MFAAKGNAHRGCPPLVIRHLLLLLLILGTVCPNMSRLHPLTCLFFKVDMTVPVCELVFVIFETCYSTIWLSQAASV